MVVPGIGGTGLPSTITGTAQALTSDGTVTQGEVALFTNPQGVYNAWSGTWDPPAGHQWNGKYWYEPKKAERKRTTAIDSGRAVAKPATKAKTKSESVVSSDDESDAKPKKKRFKATVKQATSGDNAGTRSRRNVQRDDQDDNVRRNGRACYHCGQSGHWATQCPNGAMCFACNQTGHYTRVCPDAEVKARNDAYLPSREQQPKASAGNEERTHLVREDPETMNDESEATIRGRDGQQATGDDRTVETRAMDQSVVKTAAVRSARETVTMCGANGGGSAPLPSSHNEQVPRGEVGDAHTKASESELGLSDDDNLHEDKYTKDSNAVTVTPRNEVTRCDSDESKSDDNGVSGGMIDDSVAQVRLARRRARKQAKRQRVKVVLARRQRVKLEAAAEEQLVADELRTARRKMR
ncbi:unnamed protein product [Phytophthora fragariaefolia]|uniref:Unnamed protein product n=1 Tax=Phytophthora fragariaefolia TaxID=1490495 RepID=A0A9W6XUF2_9STRA|nr:unnamed protein product [Phytophthora fragariaefolia]